METKITSNYQVFWLPRVKLQKMYEENPGGNPLWFKLVQGLS